METGLPDDIDSLHPLALPLLRNDVYYLSPAGRGDATATRQKEAVARLYQMIDLIAAARAAQEAAS